MIQEKCKELRRAVFEIAVKEGSGYITSCFSCVEILVALYYEGILRYHCKDPLWEDRDRFVLSKGWASTLLYLILADRGFFPKETVRGYFVKDVPGAEVFSQSVGTGLGVAAGMALAAKMNGKKHRVYTVMGDAECNEGAVWEAAQFAAHYKLNNLVAIIDDNKMGVCGHTTSELNVIPLGAKWASFGWHTESVGGHDISALTETIRFTKHTSAPLCINAHTIKGYGVSFLENAKGWHGVVPKGDYEERARKELS